MIVAVGFDPFHFNSEIFPNLISKIDVESLDSGSCAEFKRCIAGIGNDSYLLVFFMLSAALLTSFSFLPPHPTEVSITPTINKIIYFAVRKSYLLGEMKELNSMHYDAWVF